MQLQKLQLVKSVSYTHLRAHETKANLVCRLLLEKKKKKIKKKKKQKKKINKRREIEPKRTHDLVATETISRVY